MRGLGEGPKKKNKWQRTEDEKISKKSKNILKRNPKKGDQMEEADREGKKSGAINQFLSVRVRRREIRLRIGSGLVGRLQTWNSSPLGFLTKVVRTMSTMGTIRRDALSRLERGPARGKEFCCSGVLLP